MIVCVCFTSTVAQGAAVGQVHHTGTVHGPVVQLQQLQVDAEGRVVAERRRHGPAAAGSHTVLLVARQRHLLPQRRLPEQVSR